MAAIRVLQVLTIMNRGGAETMIMNYYRQIDREKVQFDFLVHRKQKAAFHDEIESLGGKIYRMPPINPLFPKVYYDKLRSFFEVHKEYNIVHSHLNTFSSFPLKIAEEFSIPCRIAHAHIAIDKIKLYSILSGKENPKEAFKKLIKFWLKRKVKKGATHLFSCGEKAGEWLFGKDQVFEIINNAIDTKNFVYKEKKRSQLRTFHKVKDELVIGHVGRFDSQKNHSFLIKIFEAVLRTKEDSRLVLIGDGGLFSSIVDEAEKLGIKDKIVFLGVREDVSQLLQMIDVFVFPSYYEGLPVTLVEAQAAGLKVFASDSITDEVGITDNLQFISLDLKPEYWAKKIIDSWPYNRKNTSELIEQGNFDIISNTESMQQFYLQQHKE